MSFWFESDESSAGTAEVDDSLEAGVPDSAVGKEDSLLEGEDGVPGPSAVTLPLVVFVSACPSSLLIERGSELECAPSAKPRAQV